MTRGTFIITNGETTLESTEFNGDMYPSGYGDIAFKMLEETNDFAGFYETISQFNKEHHNYRNEKLVWDKENLFDKPNYINFSKDYFDRFFSNWLFIKNIGKETINFKDSDGNLGTIKPNETIRLSFGRIPEKETV